MNLNREVRQRNANEDKNILLQLRKAPLEDVKAEWPANCIPELAQPLHSGPSLTAQAGLAKVRLSREAGQSPAPHGQLALKMGKAKRISIGQRREESGYLVETL